LFSDLSKEKGENTIHVLPSCLSKWKNIRVLSSDKSKWKEKNISVLSSDLIKWKEKKTSMCRLLA
jgi:hypothetical protein